MIRPLLAVFALQLLVPSVSSAQLGGLVKKAKKSAEEAVIPFTPLPAPEFSDRVPEITAERLGQLLKGFEAEAANAKTAKAEYEAWQKTRDQEEAAYQEAVKAYDRALPGYTACRDKFMEAEAKASAANEAAFNKPLEEMGTEEFAKYVEALARRGEALARRQQAGNLDAATDPEWRQYLKEVTVMQKEQDRRMKAAMAGFDAERERARTEDPRLVAACGQRPKQPTRPTDAVTGPESILMQKGSQAANLQGQDNSQQMVLARYTITRERVLHWVQSKQRPSGMGFSKDEIAVLEAQAKAVNEAAEKMKKAGVPL
ncbi:MAG TPA: hypothetical protein VF862_05300 [Gemmatimonadales bacterium]